MPRVISRVHSFVLQGIDAIACELDYYYIKDHPEFAGRNTSAEIISRWFA